MTNRSSGLVFATVLVTLGGALGLGTDPIETLGLVLGILSTTALLSIAEKLKHQ